MTKKVAKPKGTTPRAPRKKVVRKKVEGRGSSVEGQNEDGTARREQRDGRSEVGDDSAFPLPHSPFAYPQPPAPTPAAGPRCPTCNCPLVPPIGPARAAIGRRRVRRQCEFCGRKFVTTEEA